MVLEHQQTYRPMKQNEKPNDGYSYLLLSNICQRCQKHTRRKEYLQQMLLKKLMCTCRICHLLHKITPNESNAPIRNPKSETD